MDHAHVYSICTTATNVWKDRCYPVAEEDSKCPRSIFKEEGCKSWKSQSWKTSNIKWAAQIKEDTVKIRRYPNTWHKLVQARANCMAFSTCQTLPLEDSWIVTHTCTFYCTSMRFQRICVGKACHLAVGWSLASIEVFEGKRIMDDNEELVVSFDWKRRGEGNGRKIMKERRKRREEKRRRGKAHRQRKAISRIQNPEDRRIEKPQRTTNNSHRMIGQHDLHCLIRQSVDWKGDNCPQFCWCTNTLYSKQGEKSIL